MSDDNEKVQLSVMGISYYPLQSGAFGMLLQVEGSPKRLLIVIGAAEAQSIAIKLESVVTPRPMTHDLFVGLSQAFGLRMVEAFIYEFKNGIYSAEIKFTDGEREVRIDSRASDAVALAMRTGAPIYTTREIVEETGRLFNEVKAKPSNDEEPEAVESIDPNEEEMSDEDLQSALQKCIEEENYEEAARISEIIKSRKENNE